jgi:hypothetical protein
VANANGGLEELLIRLATELGGTEGPADDGATPLEELAEQLGAGDAATGAASAGSSSPSSAGDAAEPLAEAVAQLQGIGQAGAVPWPVAQAEPPQAGFDAAGAGSSSPSNGGDATGALAAAMEQLQAVEQADVLKGLVDGASGGAEMAAVVQSVTAAPSDAAGAGSSSPSGAGDAAEPLAEAVAQLGRIGQAGAVPEPVEGLEARDAAPLGKQAEQGQGASDAAGAGDAAGALAAAVEQLRAVEQVQADAVGQSAGASAQSSSSGSSALDTVGSAVASVFESGLGVSPLISGLVSLFGGGGDATAPPALSEYTAPESVQFEGDVYRGANATDWGGSGGMQSGGAVTTSPQQITVQVNAMDSQSFLDHSQDIARAVRQAMLNSNSLNDVVSDL